MQSTCYARKAILQVFEERKSVKIIPILEIIL